MNIPELKRKLKRNYFNNSVLKYGPENFKLEILEDNVPNDKLDEL